MRKPPGGGLRDKGTRFETLIRDWLTKEPTYRDLFSEVLTYKEWSNRYPKLAGSSRDIGIDLVGVNTDDDGFTAIQCKFYGKDVTVSKAGVDSFIAASNKPFFTKRFLVATNEKWSNNVREEFDKLQPAVTLITREDFVRSTIDWAQYLKTGELKEVAKRTPRPYQKEAIQRVLDGFKEQDRGKLVMACGTGKTYTSLKIAEEQAGRGKLVLFLVPSLALLSQTLSDWKQQCIYPIKAFAVCSDRSIGKGDLEELDSLTVGSELAYPASTKAEKLGEQVVRALANNREMTVVFSTYQSIDVIHEAQKLDNNAVSEFDLVICDEAHRTCGGHWVGEAESQFTRIHDNDFVAAKKRLYMTATPKIYGADAKKQSEEGDVVLYSMDNERIFGKTFHTINFTEAVRLGSLVDYKVIVLSVNESILGDKYEGELAVAADGGISASHAAKVIGCWRALSKRDLQGEVSMGNDLQPMKRAVGFAQVIEPGRKYDKVSSKAFTAAFQGTIENFKEKLWEESKGQDKEDFEAQNSLICDTRHIDGSMDATEKANRLEWLRAPVEDNHCKILFNVRCLSEGVDVPSLDAVLFLSPRKSMVDVVQTVGRVMRTSKGTNKERGYVIIPVVTPAGVPADAVLDNNKDFDTVWQVLRALKSIDDDFGSMVDGQLKSINSQKMEVICITNKEFSSKTKKKAEGKGGKTGPGSNAGKKTLRGKQYELSFTRDEYLEGKIRARIVKKVGNRKEWADWAEEVGVICQTQIQHIKTVIDDPKNAESKKKFEAFSKELKETLNGELSEEDVREMLGQHIVTKPVVDALFAGFPFSEKNPIAKAMSTMLEALDEAGMKSATKLLDGFYNSVKIRTKNIKTEQDRQTVILELFDNFFKVAFPKMREKLGIIYTRVEVVDFINQSVADILKKEFNKDISSNDVHVLDPFTGTGTFICRLLQSGLISKDKLLEKYRHSLHAQEIVPLAYYVASMNMEAIMHDKFPEEEYMPNEVMIWTDTFASNEQKTDLFKTTLAENNKRLQALNGENIEVIIGNPPYSVGQDSANDDNRNEHYEQLDKRLAATYVAGTKSSNKNKLYDSYIRAYRWASDRIGDKGIIGFITNAGWLESSSADGMRKCMAEEFSSIYVYHLKGNQRTSGERSRKEGGKIFGEGSRAPVAIVILVKNPEDKEKGKIFYHEVADYLTREEKLKEVANYGSIENIKWRRIFPNEHGDWLNLRESSSASLMIMGRSKALVPRDDIFDDYSLGVNTNRDNWVYNSSKDALLRNVGLSIRAFNEQCIPFVQEEVSKVDWETLEKRKRAEKETEIVSKTAKKFSSKVKWASSLDRRALKNREIIFNQDSVVDSIYRPFVGQYLYYDRFGGFTHRPGHFDKYFPNGKENLVICVNQGAQDAGHIALMTNMIPDIHFNGDSQCFPYYIYEEKSAKAKTVTHGEEDLFSNYVTDEDEVPPNEEGKHTRKEAITDDALDHFRDAYLGKDISKKDLFYYIYGLLHSEDYRKKYANNLMKELPRIPRVATFEQFTAFKEAGEKLGNLHLNFEKQPRYENVNVIMKPNASFRVEKMKWGKIPGRTGNAAKDKTRLIYNGDITIENIPLEAQDYVVNKKSALDWLVERCRVTVDKASGIVNDFNKYGEEKGLEHYPYDLFLKVITVSLETVKIVKALPPLEIHPLDKA